MIKQAFFGTVALFVMVLIYSLGRARGYKDGMFGQWVMTQALNYSIWHGTGEDGDIPDFPGLARYMDGEAYDEVLHPDGVELKRREG